MKRRVLSLFSLRFHLKRSHRIVSYGIFETLNGGFDMREGEVINPVAFEQEGSFLQSLLRQVGYNLRLRIKLKETRRARFAARPPTARRRPGHL